MPSRIQRQILLVFSTLLLASCASQNVVSNRNPAGVEQDGNQNNVVVTSITSSSDATEVNGVIKGGAKEPKYLVWDAKYSHFVLGTKDPNTHQFISHYIIGTFVGVTPDNSNISADANTGITGYLGKDVRECDSTQKTEKMDKNTPVVLPSFEGLKYVSAVVEGEPCHGYFSLKIALFIPTSSQGYINTNSDYWVQLPFLWEKSQLITEADPKMNPEAAAALKLASDATSLDRMIDLIKKSHFDRPLGEYLKYEEKSKSDFWRIKNEKVFEFLRRREMED